MKVLVVEDDPNMLEFLKAHLPARGFAVDEVSTGRESIQLAATSEYDLVLLDLNLPDMRGEEVVQEMQQNEHVPPILMLTVVGDADSKVRLLSAGADDYLSKPFSFDELVARMRALLRRSREMTPDTAAVGDLTFDGSKQSVSRKGKEVSLTSKEYTLFAYLVHHRGEMVPKSRLIEHAWDSSADPFSNSLETHMTNLRKKLGSSNPIRTVHGHGYIIDF